MRNYLSGLLFVLAAGGVFAYNGQDTGQVLAFPFITSIFPATEGDPVAMGVATVKLMLGIGGLLLAFGAVRHRRQSRD